MTIWFHEGLPRSGKSYEAMVKHALPAIEKGRHVVTNIKGVNSEKIAEVLNIPVEEVESLITIIPWEQTTECFKFVKNDCILLLDEVQDFWPATRDRLGKEITELITQHGQRGLDIILMGQANKDCHALWRRRIDKLIYFVQKDAIGQPTKYSWSLYKQVAPDKFSKITSGSGSYDKKFFGIYSSHVQGTSNKEAYQDDRANILKTPAIRFGVPFAVLSGVFAVWYLISVFSSPQKMVGQASAATLSAVEVMQPIKADVQQQEAKIVEEVEQATEKKQAVAEASRPDFVDDLFNEFRPRLAALMHSETKTVGRIEFYLSDGHHRRDVLSFAALRQLGWSVEVTEYGVLIAKGVRSYAVTPWPFDVVGQVPERVQQSAAITGADEPVF